MNLRNNVQLIGNIGKIEELKNLPNGKLLRFFVATNDNYKNSEGEWVQKTDWHQITSWNKAAEIVANNFKVGDHVTLNGQLKTNSWTNEIDGTTHYATSVVLDRIQKLISRDNKTNKQNNDKKVEVINHDEVDDLPF